MLNSYSTALDPIAEALQNAIDAAGSGSAPITVTVTDDYLEVVDRGPGLRCGEFLRCLKPGVSGKQRGTGSGAKGVGLTFLAYCSNRFEFESWCGDERYAYELTNGRAWAEDREGYRWPAQPQLRRIPQRLEQQGTRVRVALDHPGLRDAIASSTATVWAIRTSTPLGRLAWPEEQEVGIGPAPDETERSDGPVAEDVQRPAPVQAPVMLVHHGSTPLRVPVGMPLPSDACRSDSVTRSVLDLDQDLGTAAAEHYGGYDACYAFYGTRRLLELLDDDSREAKALDRYAPRAYVCFASKASYYQELVEARGADWATSHGIYVIAHGQPLLGEPRRVTLRSETGYYNRFWVLWDLVGAEPDLGRKSIPGIDNALQSATQKLAKDVLDRARNFIRPDDHESRKQRSSTSRSAELQSWDLGDLGTLSYGEVVEEQDVVALFNLLAGRGVLAHMMPRSFFGAAIYDAKIRYDHQLAPANLVTALPGDNSAAPQEYDVEFKYRAVDFAKETQPRGSKGPKKRWEDVTFIVCWSIGRDRNHEFMKPATAVLRRYHGVTHIRRSRPVVYVIALEELLKAIQQN